MRLGSITRKLIVALGCSMGMSLHGCGRGETTEELSFPEMTLTAHDRILILAPHPDDEVLGAGGVIQQAVAAHSPLRIVFFTYGDNNEWSFMLYRKRPVVKPEAVERMGLVRHDEAVAADKILGVPPEHLIFLGYPDFGTLNIWYTHWGNSPPFRSMLTRVTAVPYQNALRPGASYKGEEILQDLKSVLREFRPTKIFVSHPGDHNSDHLALHLFTRVALWDLTGEMNPEVYPYLVHVKRWPAPRGYHPADPLVPPALFAHEVQWRTLRLSPVQTQRKDEALKAHRTQYDCSAKYLVSFVRSNELFGDFPSIVFHASAAAVSQSFGRTKVALETPEELTDVERAAFVGFEKRSVNLENGNLVLSTELSRPLGKDIGVSVHIFGYRADRPFAETPKLVVKFGAISHKVYDQDQEIPLSIVQVARSPQEITIRVPLKALGEPRKILIEARSYLGEVPLDWAAWRTIELAPS